MLEVIKSKSFKKSFKRIIRDPNFKLNEFKNLVDKLANQEILESKYKDHKLSGRYFGYRECHLQNDILLVYSIDNGELVLHLFDIGSHSELF